MFKNHDSGILTLSLFTTFTHVFCLARHYFTNARQMHWSCEGEYTMKKVNKRFITHIDLSI